MKFTKFIPVRTRSRNPKVSFNLRGIITLNKAAVALTGLSAGSQIDLVTGEDNKIYIYTNGNSFTMRATGKEGTSLVFNCSSLVSYAASLYDMPLAEDKKSSVKLDIIVAEEANYYQLF